MRGDGPLMIPVAAKTPAHADASLTRVAHRDERKRWFEVWIPYVLAILFCVSALRGVGATDVIDTDAARHAMNGAFIYDLVRTGHWSKPIEYGKTYYAQRPALSMPFHPPLFPVIEAVFFSLFGVKLLTARLLVALCVGICAVLLYRMVLAKFGSYVLAACVTITTFSLWTVQFVARDVMLEFPAMVFTLAAVLCLRDLDESYSMRRALLFAIFAAAAVWTKQHAVFLGAIPILHAVLTRRWRRFVEGPLWVSSVLFGAAVLALIRLSHMFHGAGVNQMGTATSDVYWIITRTLPAYFDWIADSMKGLPGIFAVSAIGAYAWGVRRRSEQTPKMGMYYAWIIALCALLLDLGPVSPRYLFFVLPAVITVLYTWLFYGCCWLWSERLANIVVGAFVVAWFAVGLTIPLDFLRGPGAAAGVIVHEGPTRVLYVGTADGNFVFSVRTLDPNLQATVIPAGKLPHNMIEEADADAFCQKYGIEWVVFENVPDRQFWSHFHEGLQRAGKLERSVPLESTRSRWQRGTIEVYRFKVSRNRPQDVLELRVPNLGESIQVKL